MGSNLGNYFLGLVLIVILSLFAGSFASAETISVNVDLKSKDIISVLDQSLTTTAFDAHGTELYSSFDGVITSPRIVDLVIPDDKVTQIKVALFTSFSTFDVTTHP